MIIHSFCWMTLWVCATSRETDMLSKWLIRRLNDHTLTSVPFCLLLHLASSLSSTSIIFPSFPSSLSFSLPRYQTLFFSSSSVLSHLTFNIFTMSSPFTFVPYSSRQLNSNVASLFWLAQLPPSAWPPAMSNPWRLPEHLAMTCQFLLPTPSLTSAL